MQIKSSVTQTLLGLFPLALLVSPDLPATSLPDPGGYDQCVQESMKGITSDRSAAIAMHSCREKSLEGKFTDDDLPADAFGKLVTHAGFGYGVFSGTIYNGNSDYTVTQVTIAIAPAGPKKAAGVSVGSKEYNIELTVQPLAKGALSMPIPSDNTLEYSWSVVKGRGYKTR